jgi:hypothetical protein
VLRYFVSHGDVVSLPSPDDHAVARALDAFVLGSVGGPRRVVVARDLAGELFLVDEDGVAGLPDSVRSVVARHELARGRPPRFIDASELWLMSVDLLEQAADSPGTNDPVHVYGRLSGPWGSTTSTPHAAHGQLTVTRGDLLRGFFEGARQPFFVDGGVMLHALVPGGPVDDVGVGRGVVLAWALLPWDAGGLDGGNEPCALQIFDALVGALQDDLRRHGARNTFTARTLPVADRGALEARMVAEGFLIHGDVAEKKTGIFARERRPLPPEWRVDDLEPVAADALAALAPAFPDPRSTALWARVHARAPATFSIPAPPHAAAVPTSSTPRREKPATIVQQPFRRSEPDWMADFAPPPGTPAPRRARVTPTAPSTSRRPTASPGSARPEWMKDFE